MAVVEAEIVHFVCSTASFCVLGRTFNGTLVPIRSAVTENEDEDSRMSTRPSRRERRLSEREGALSSMTPSSYA